MEPTLSVPAELHRSRPRPVRLSGTGRTLATVMIVLFISAPVAGLSMYRSSVRQRETVRQIESAGVVTPGIVTALKRESKDANRASVFYEFAAADHTVADRAKVRMSLWKTLRVGDTVPIRYLPSAPSQNYPDGHPDQVLPLWLSSVIATLFAIGGLLCVFHLTRERRLLSDGRVTEAVVTEHKVHRSQHGTHRSMRYQFTLMNGSLCVGKTGTGRTPPPIGSRILVVYDPETPARNRPYPFTLYRIDDDF